MQEEDTSKLSSTHNLHPITYIRENALAGMSQRPKQESRHKQCHKHKRIFFLHLSPSPSYLKAKFILTRNKRNKKKTKIIPRHHNIAWHGCGPLCCMRLPARNKKKQTNLFFSFIPSVSFPRLRGARAAASRYRELTQRSRICKTPRLWESV